jgi:SAM-dependent methyltransferase
MGQSLGESGVALDLGCGRGANTHYLASLGYDAIGLDCSFEALRQARTFARETKTCFAAVDLDNYALPVARFDLLVVVKYLNRLLIESIRSAVRPGGLVFYRTFNRGHLQRSPRFNPDYVLAAGELHRWFEDFETIDTDDREEASLSYLLARRPGLDNA